MESDDMESVYSCIEEINILLLADANSIKNLYQKQTNPDWNNPVWVNPKFYHLFADDSRGIISGQGTSNLSFRANVKDLVSFTGSTFDNNDQNAVIVYGVDKSAGVDLFNPFVMNVVSRQQAVAPDPQSRNGLPPIYIPKTFGALHGQVVRPGTENIRISFGLYTLDNDGQKQSLYGYFCGQASVTVQGQVG